MKLQYWLVMFVSSRLDLFAKAVDPVAQGSKILWMSLRILGLVGHQSSIFSICRNIQF